jgi:hypothetical protein
VGSVSVFWNRWGRFGTLRSLSRTTVCPQEMTGGVDGAEKLDEVG